VQLVLQDHLVQLVQPVQLDQVLLVQLGGQVQQAQLLAQLDGPAQLDLQVLLDEVLLVLQVQQAILLVQLDGPVQLVTMALLDLLEQLDLLDQLVLLEQLDLLDLLE
jgi:hypothetical protein